MRPTPPVSGGPVGRHTGESLKGAIDACPKKLEVALNKPDERKLRKHCVCSALPKPPDDEIQTATLAHSRLLRWRQQHWKRPRAGTNLTAAQLRVAAMRYRFSPLLAQGLDVVLAAGDYPEGTLLEDLPFYPTLVRAFSRAFGPKLFEELMMPDPFAAGEPYWDNFFYQVSPNTNPPLLRVIVQKGGTLCFGVTGQFQSPSGPVWLYDCSSEAEVFHEIGHVIMDAGILAGRSPLYFHYATGGSIPIGGNSPIVDSKALLIQWFGKKLDQGTDIDGVPVGFVTDYATMNAKEDFAETLRYYVYEPSVLFDKVGRQEANGSITLGEKAALIAGLYQGMYFNDGGIPAGWPGYRL
jgi:hypothetical protein